MKINKEGYKIIFVSGVICLAIWGFIYFLLNKHEDIVLLGLSAAVLAVFWFLIVSFFREPRRVKIHDEALVFAPCDGRVVVTEVVNEHEYFGGAEVMQISIFMSVTNVHMNWFPVGRMYIIFFATLFGGCDWTPKARNSFCHSSLQPDDLSSELQNSKER